MSAESILHHDHKELEDLLEQVKKALFVDNNQVFSKLDRFWARLAMHIRAEHLHLFPALQNVIEQTSETGELIESLREDHNFFMHELAIAIKTMRSITVETEAIESVRKIISLVAARLERHNDFEESEIYPLVSLLFDSTEQGRLIDGIERELRNLPQRFK